jgi:hypothetical protein
MHYKYSGQLLREGYDFLFALRDTPKGGGPCAAGRETLEEKQAANQVGPTATLFELISRHNL